MSAAKGAGRNQIRFFTEIAALAESAQTGLLGGTTPRRAQGFSQEPRLDVDRGDWRIDRRERAGEWYSGAGAKPSRGRWNPKGMSVVYGSLGRQASLDGTLSGR